MKPYRTEYFRMLEDYINGFQEQNGHAPTIYEMEADLGIPKSTVSRYLHYMTDHKMLEYEGARKITTSRTEGIRRETVGLPVLGSVACGLPKYAEENIEEYVRVPASWFGTGKFFALRADGPSMINAGINTGDLVIVKQQSTAEPGQIVVALVDDDTATLKRYCPHPEEGTVDLVPENDEFETQTYSLDRHSIVIQGIAVKVLKELA